MPYRDRPVSAAVVSVFALFLHSMGIASAVAAPDFPVLPVSRQAFARRMRHVHVGMREEQVKAILGKPDYIGHFSFRRRVLPDISLAWFYGCVGPQDLPTLGTVAFDHHGRVLQTEGGESTPPPPAVISEKELRQALSLLAQTPVESQYNPVAMIRVVNGLLPFGKIKILAAIQEYQRTMGFLFPRNSVEWQSSFARTITQKTSSFRLESLTLPADSDALIFLLHVIFDIPGGTDTETVETEPMPIPAIGMLSPAPPKDTRIAPRFPIVLIDDVPFLELNKVIMPSGFPEQVQESLPYFRQQGSLRVRPLRPPDPIEPLLERLQSSPQWLVGRRYEVVHHDDSPAFYEPNQEEIQQTTDTVKREILWMVSPLYPTAIGLPQNRKRLGVSEDLEDSLPLKAAVRQWDPVIQDIKKNPVRWNPTMNAYEHIKINPITPQ